jgi:hypothetical protein
LLLEPVECRVQRSLIDAENVARELLNSLGDRPPVARFGDERAENQEIEGALEEVEASGHGVDSLHQQYCTVGVGCQQQETGTALAESRSLFRVRL